MAGRLRERAVKAALLAQLRSRGVSIDDVLDWLCEEFGIRARRSWRNIERLILRSNEITSQDLVVFMVENGIEPDEGAWDAERVLRLRGSADSKEDR
jgi:hypothetical protein